MNAQDIRALAARAIGGIAPEADIASLSDDEDLRDALDLDSMDFLNFLIAIGTETGRRIPDADAPRLRTIAGLQAYFAADAAPAQAAASVKE